MNDTIEDIVTRNHGTLIHECCMGHVFFVLVGPEPVCRYDYDRTTRHSWYVPTTIVTQKLRCANMIIHFTSTVNDQLRTFFRYYAMQRTTVRIFFLRAKQIGPKIQAIEPEPDEDDVYDIIEPTVLDGIQFVAANVASVRTRLIELSVLTQRSTDHLLCSAYRVPAHHVTSLLDLVNLVIHDRLIVVFPHYTCHCLLSNQDVIRGAIEKLRDDTRRNTNYLPTFVNQLARYTSIETAAYEFMRDYPRYSSFSVYGRDGYGESDVVLQLDTDAIADTLDRDGWTSLMVDFAREQLKIDWMHSHEFVHFLLSRTDTPPEVFH